MHFKMLIIIRICYFYKTAKETKFPFSFRLLICIVNKQQQTTTSYTYKIKFKKKDESNKRLEYIYINESPFYENKHDSLDHNKEIDIKKTYVEIDEESESENEVEIDIEKSSDYDYDLNTKFITNNTINFENEEENNVNECVMVDDSEFNKNNNYFYGVKKNNYVRSFNPR